MMTYDIVLANVEWNAYGWDILLFLSH